MKIPRHEFKSHHEAHTFALVDRPLRWIGSSSLRAEEADLVVRNGKVLVCDTGMTIAEAFAVRQGRIVAVGSEQSMQAWIGSKTQVVELDGKTVLPGFCDSHLHFVGLGDSLQSLDLRNVENWDALIDAVAEKAKATPKGTWIDGRGWHQSKWNPVPSPSVEGYPIHTKLSERVPDHPVLLTPHQRTCMPGQCRRDEARTSDRRN